MLQVDAQGQPFHVIVGQHAHFVEVIGREEKAGLFAAATQGNGMALLGTVTQQQVCPIHPLVGLYGIPDIGNKHGFVGGVGTGSHFAFPDVIEVSVTDKGIGIINHTIDTIVTVVAYLGFPGCALFGRDNDHTVGALGSVNRGGRGVLEYFDGFNVTGIEVVVTAPLNAIDHEQGAVVPVDGAVATDGNVDPGTGVTR